MISFSRNTGRGVRRPQLRHAEYREGNQIGFAPDRSDSDLVVPQGEAAVLTHLLSVASECRDVTVVIGDQLVRGLIGVPELKRLEIPFHPHRELEGVPTGGIIRVQYTLGGEAVRFRTRLIRRKTGWHFGLPRAVESTSRRLAPRHPVHASWHVDMRRGGPLRSGTVSVVDAAAGGLALRVPVANADGLVGRMMAGVLRNVSGLAVPVQLQVQHRRVPSDPAESPIVGASFHGIGFDNQLRIVEALRQQQERREQREATLAHVPERERPLAPTE
ncbi:MAG: hypothetical protein VX265_01475 [Myxococcota bacterium]|nr:hypothetical protein [Myxococcota bacterium]